MMVPLVALGKNASKQLWWTDMQAYCQFLFRQMCAHDFAGKKVILRPLLKVITLCHDGT